MAAAGKALAPVAVLNKPIKLVFGMAVPEEVYSAHAERSCWNNGMDSACLSEQSINSVSESNGQFCE